MQHEYGIFGGDDGAYILDFLDALRVPGAVTLHTVLDRPSPSQRAIVQKMAKAAVLVVMSQVAADLLARRYELQSARVEIVPHGIPDIAPRAQEGLKARFGVAGQRMLLTFGLLEPNKGIETVIRALPALVADHSDLVYFVVGATHPAVLREHGEAYRTSLERWRCEPIAEPGAPDRRGRHAEQWPNASVGLALSPKEGDAGIAKL